MSKLTRQGWFWAMVPVILLATTAVSVICVARIALDDPGFSVEKDYYKKSSRFDAEQRERASSLALGWHLQSELTVTGKSGQVVVTLRDRDGQPMSGASLTAEAFAVSRGNLRQSLAFQETTAGRYQADMQNGRPGLWELRFVVQRGAERFTVTQKQDAAISLQPSTREPS